MIKITISLKQFLLHYKDRGQRYACIDKELMDQVTAQQDWEKEYYFESCNEQQTVFRLWFLQDYQHHAQNDAEIKRDTFVATQNKAKELHNKLETWKLNTRKLLNQAGKLSSAQIDKVIQATITPKDQQDFAIRAKMIAKFSGFPEELNK